MASNFLKEIMKSSAKVLLDNGILKLALQNSLPELLGLENYLRVERQKKWLSHKILI